MKGWSTKGKMLVKNCGILSIYRPVAADTAVLCQSRNFICQGKLLFTTTVKGVEWDLREGCQRKGDFDLKTAAK